MKFRKTINNQIWHIRKLINRMRYPLFYGNKIGLTILSQNCIGAVEMNLLNMTFLTPTVNMFFPMPDFVKFCENILHYAECSDIVQDFELTEAYGYPVLRLDDIVLHCVHYKDQIDFETKWRERIKRVNLENVFLIMTDRDGFQEQLLPRIEKLPFPKVLFSHKTYPEYDFVVGIDAFEGSDKVGNIVEYYKFTGHRLYEKYYDFPNAFLKTRKRD